MGRSLIDTGEGKSVVMGNGSLALRDCPPATNCRDDEKVIEVLHEMGLSRYVRTREELDRESLLARREDLPRIEGLSFVQREVLTISPTGAKVITKTRTIKL